MTDSDQDKAAARNLFSRSLKRTSPKTLRLRSERPRVTRLSRKVLAGGAAFALALVSGAVLWALQSNQKRSPAPEELFTTDHHNVADGLVGLPKDYAGIPRDVPRLGPPLPGDLGRPIVAAQINPVHSRLMLNSNASNQESEAARTSKVFAATNVRPLAATTASNETPANAASSSDEASLRTGRIGSSPSSTHPSIAGPQVPIALPSQRRLSWSKQERLFRPLSSLASAPICQARSRPRSPKTSMTRQPAGRD